MLNLRNQVQLIGKLGNNPEVMTFDSGKKKVTFPLTTVDVYKNAKGEKVVETQWHNLIAWGKTADNIEVFLKKGNEVAVSGKLQHKSYKDKAGNSRRFTQILINEFMLLTNTPFKSENEVASDVQAVAEPKPAF